jgi:hypothetical protein
MFFGMNWQAALTAAKAAGSSGGFAWRLPNIKELTTLEELGCSNFAINATIFPETPNGTWSSTSYAANPREQVWIVYFDSGSVYVTSKTDGYTVRLVRSSQ